MFVITENIMKRPVFREKPVKKKKKKERGKERNYKGLITAFNQTSRAISSTHSQDSGIVLQFGGCEFFVSPIKRLVPMVT
jgi:hypothetical protein